MAGQSLFMRIGNSSIKLILRSPFHGMLSSNFLLINVSGRKTGKTYSFPVNYYHQEELLRVTSLRSRTWWRNLRGGYRVSLRLQGQDVPAWGNVIEDDQGVTEALAAYMQQSPAVARAYKITLDPAGHPAMDEVRQLATSRVIIDLKVSQKPE